MKTLFTILLMALCFTMPTATPATAAQLENVGPRGDKEHSGDLYARRYARMLDRWKDGSFNEGNTTQQAALEQRYRAAPQTVQLAQEDPSLAAAPTCNCNCNGQPVAAAAPRTPVEQQSLQPLYSNQASNSMMPPVVITGSNY